MKKFLSDTLFITAGGLVNRVKGLLFIPLIIAAVGMDSYGAFVQILNNIRLAKPFSSIGLGMGFQRYASKIEKQNRKELSLHFYSVFLPTLAFGLVGVALLYGISPWLSRMFFEGKFVEALQVSSLALLSNTVYSNISKYMLARKQFKSYSVLTLIYELFPYLAFVAGIFFWEDFLGGIIAYVVTDLLMVSVMLGFIVVKMPFSLPSRALFLQYFHFSYPLAISEVEGGLLDKVDRYFISGMMGLEAVGVYNIIYRVCSIIDFITTPIRKQMMSYLPKVWDKGYVKESLATIRNSLLVFLLITTGMLAGFTLYFQDILNYLGGKDEVHVPYLEWIVLLIGLGIIGSAAKRFYYLVVKLRNNSMDQLVYQLVGLVPNIILNYFLIPPLGLLGAALATFVSYVLIIIIINFKYKLDIDGAFFLHLLSFLAISAVMWPIREAFQMDNFFLFLLNLSLAFGAYYLLAFLLKRSFLLGVKRSFEEFRRIQ